MTDYEILLMLDAELPDERQNEIVTRAREAIERDGGRFDAHEPWGRRRLAYEIGHKGEGSYHLLTFAAEPATLAEISRVLKITDGVMRHLATRRIESAHGPGRPGPEPVLEAPSVDRTSEYAAVTNTRSQDAPELETAPEIESAPSIPVSSEIPVSSNTEEA